MLVATFGPTTGWEGREIIWDVDRFILVGHGAVPAAGILDYDRRGQLIWAQPELRAWVVEVDRWETGGRARGGSEAGTRSSGGGLPAWAIALIAGAVALVVIGLVAGALLIPRLARTGEHLAKDAVVRVGAETIHAAIESYALDHQGRYPPAGTINEQGLAPYITAWPFNPYSGAPMADGGGDGNFRYDISPDGGAYRLTVYGRGSGVLVRFSGGRDTSV